MSKKHYNLDDTLQWLAQVATTDDIIWRETCVPWIRYYYAESGLYLLRDLRFIHPSYALVFARSPDLAAKYQKTYGGWDEVGNDDNGEDQTMSDMEKVTRWRCKWCGKEFRTPDRHQCKWSPNAHNCLSCVHRGVFVKGDLHMTSLGYADGVADSFLCAKHEGADDGWNFYDIPDANPSSINSEAHHCPDYETVPNWRGKETFKEIEQKRMGGKGGAE